MSARTLVIVNPRSAGGATKKRWDKGLAARVESAIGAFEVAFTSGMGDATSLCRAALKDGYTTIVAVGGDGTINEVVNGFFDGDDRVHEEPILGIVPAGTGGDYRKTWGLSRDPEDACARLGSATPRWVDCGRVRWSDADGTERSRYFANIASFGMSGLVCERVNRSSKALGGRFSFFQASVRALFRYRRQPVEMVTDGDDSRTLNLTVGAVCVGRFFGGGMMIGAQADPSDGLFDMVTLELGKVGMARFTSIYSGTHIGRTGVQHWRGAVVEATSSGADPVLIELDGEVVGGLPARFEIVPRAFRVKA